MDLDTSLLFKRFDDEWQKQKKSQKPSMVQALVAGRWYLLVATGVGYIVAQATTLAGPLLLKQIVAGLTCRRQDDTSSCDSERMLYMCGSLKPVLKLSRPHSVVVGERETHIAITRFYLLHSTVCHTSIIHAWSTRS